MYRGICAYKYAHASALIDTQPTGFQSVTDWLPKGYIFQPF